MVKPHTGKRARSKFSQKAKEEIREAYLSNPEFSWAAFCRSLHWDSRKSGSAFPIGLWQKEWLDRRIAEADESLVTKALAVRNVVLESRLESMQNHKDIFKMLRFLTAKSLAAHVETVNKGGKAPDCATIQGFASAQRNMISAEIELAKIRPDLDNPVVGMQSKLDSFSQDDTLLNPAEIEVMGVGTMSEDQASKLALAWLDPPPPEEPKGEG